MSDRHQPGSGPYTLSDPRRCNDEHGTLHMSTSHVTIVDPHDVSDGISPTQVRGCFPLRNSRLGPQERAVFSRPLADETSFSDVPAKLRSQWSDADLALYDRHGARKRHARRHGNAYHGNGSDDDSDEMWKP